MSEIQRFQALVDRYWPVPDTEPIKPQDLVRYSDYLAAVAEARRDEIEECFSRVKDSALPKDLAQACGPDFTSGFEAGIEEARNVIRARLKELDSA